MSTFRTPDLNAPRFRPGRLGLLNTETFNKFKKKFPKYQNMTLETFKKIVNTFHDIIQETVISDRNGVELPNSIGILFVGSCRPSKKSKNIDYHKSKQCGTKVYHKNWGSDGKVAKIFYVNFPVKYKLKNREVWGFESTRIFSRRVAHSFQENWEKYIPVRDKIRISHIFKERKQRYFKKRIQDSLKDYNEFNFD